MEVKPRGGKVFEFGLEPIKLLFNAGYTIQQVADKIGVARSTLCVAMEYLWGLTPKQVFAYEPTLVGHSAPLQTQVCKGITLMDIEKAMLEERESLGFSPSTKSVADRLGIAYGTLRAGLNRIGYQPTTRIILVKSSKEEVK